jgi:hypothetical protein
MLHHSATSEDEPKSPRSTPETALQPCRGTHRPLLRYSGKVSFEPVLPAKPLASASTQCARRSIMMTRTSTLDVSLHG